jgi:hypothetical protein
MALTDAAMWTAVDNSFPYLPSPPSSPPTPQQLVQQLPTSVGFTFQDQYYAFQRAAVPKAAAATQRLATFYWSEQCCALMTARAHHHVNVLIERRRAIHRDWHARQQLSFADAPTAERLGAEIDITNGQLETLGRCMYPFTELEEQMELRPYYEQYSALADERSSIVAKLGDATDALITMLEKAKRQRVAMNAMAEVIQRIDERVAHVQALPALYVMTAQFVKMVRSKQMGAVSSVFSVTDSLGALEYCQADEARRLHLQSFFLDASEKEHGLLPETPEELLMRQKCFRWRRVLLSTYRMLSAEPDMKQFEI